MKKIVLILVGFLLFMLIYLKINKEAYTGVVNSLDNTLIDFQIKKGDGSTEVGDYLAKEGLVKNKYYFWYYVWKTKTDSKLQAGTYTLSKNMNIPEMVNKFVKGNIKNNINKLIVPEGYTIDKIIGLLKKQKPELVEEFTRIVKCDCLNKEKCECDNFSKKYDFIKEIPAGKNLEGYLFPDTYFLAKNETGATLVNKFLSNFSQKINQDIRNDIARKNMTLFQVVTMASIVEREVKNDKDRPVVAGIFWKRLKEKHPLQSDATLAYILKTNKVKYSQKEIEDNSPYNTYKHIGLPPGPICNPGLEAILATLNPEKTEYFYFLNDAKTGETIFSRNFEEHKINKKKHGL